MTPTDTNEEVMGNDEHIELVRSNVEFKKSRFALTTRYVPLLTNRRLVLLGDNAMRGFLRLISHIAGIMGAAIVITGASVLPTACMRLLGHGPAALGGPKPPNLPGVVQILFVIFVGIPLFLLGYTLGKSFFQSLLRIAYPAMVAFDEEYGRLKVDSRSVSDTIERLKHLASDWIECVRADVASVTLTETKGKLRISYTSGQFEEFVIGESSPRKELGILVEALTPKVVVGVGRKH